MLNMFFVSNGGVKEIGVAPRAATTRQVSPLVAALESADNDVWWYKGAKIGGKAEPGKTKPNQDHHEPYAPSTAHYINQHKQQDRLLARQEMPKEAKKTKKDPKDKGKAPGKQAPKGKGKGEWQQMTRGKISGINVKKK